MHKNLPTLENGINSPGEAFQDMNEEQIIEWMKDMRHQTAGNAFSSRAPEPITLIQRATLLKNVSRLQGDGDNSVKQKIKKILNGEQHYLFNSTNIQGEKDWVATNILSKALQQLLPETPPIPSH